MAELSHPPDISPYPKGSFRREVKQGNSNRVYNCATVDNSLPLLFLCIASGKSKISYS